MATIKHTSPGQSKPSQCEWINMTLVGSGRSLLAGLLADFLNKRRRRSFPQQRRGAKAEKDSSRRYRASGWSVTPETASLMVQHHGNSHGLQCGGLYHQVWGCMAFFLL